jgi:hypothetical protein
MAYVIAEPCIGTKDLSCLEVCAWGVAEVHADQRRLLQARLAKRQA